MKPDQLNAGFEALAALLIWLNVADVWKKKATAGIHWIPLSLFTIWGYWNLFYYPHLGQWWSFAAAGFVAVANSAWLWLVVKYR